MLQLHVHRNAMSATDEKDFLFPVHSLSRSVWVFPELRCFAFSTISVRLLVYLNRGIYAVYKTD